ncbi:hypothetical protein ACFC1T_09715 [Kitasatospora sp. NPDC056076]|uniref:hypothetical protein n=1 Tax=Kitasatospora sp. NPDC056076 TaxID=3345703 RepID=UPI0035D6D8CE
MDMKRPTPPPLAHGVAVIVTNRAGQVLLHEPVRAGNSARRWAVHASRVFGHESVLQAAVRVVGDAALTTVEPTDVVELFQLDQLPAPLGTLSVFAALWRDADRDGAYQIPAALRAEFFDVADARVVPAGAYTARVLEVYESGLSEWNRLRGITSAWAPPTRQQTFDPMRRLTALLDPKTPRPGAAGHDDAQEPALPQAPAEPVRADRVDLAGVLAAQQWQQDPGGARVAPAGRRPKRERQIELRSLLSPHRGA